MAERELTAAVGDAVVGLLEWSLPRLRPSAREIFERVVDTVRPEPPITLCSIDGRECLTGIAMMSRGRVLGFVGWRHPQHVSFGPERRHYGVEEPLWNDGIEPYHR